MIARQHDIVAIGLRPRDAARALGISPRKLWSLTVPRGPIKCVRLGSRGSAILYRPADLDAWLLTMQGGRGDDV